MYCTIYAAKTKVLIRCMIILQLICAFVLFFAYAKIRFSHDVAHIIKRREVGEYVFYIEHI